jgi:hypothetical protein
MMTTINYFSHSEWPQQSSPWKWVKLGCIKIWILLENRGLEVFGFPFPFFSSPFVLLFLHLLTWVTSPHPHPLLVFGFSVAAVAEVWGWGPCSPKLNTSLWVSHSPAVHHGGVVQSGVSRGCGFNFLPINVGSQTAGTKKKKNHVA